MGLSKADTRVYRTLLTRALKISAPLANAIRNVGPVSSRRSGYPSIGHFLARAIIGQQLSASAARSIRSRVTQAASDAKMEVTELSVACAEDVRACGVSMNKIKALQSVRRAERNGTLRETQLQRLEPQERTQILMRIHGVGPWTCDMAQIFYFHEPDIWPEGDVAVQRTFKRLIGRRSPRRTAERFSPYRSFLALTMWRVVDGGD